MAEKKNANVVEEATKTEVVASVDGITGEVTTEVVDEGEALATGLVVYRDIYKKNGKTYFAYHVAGEIRGRRMVADLIPKDVGGYDWLDVIFNGERERPLYMRKGSMKNDRKEVVEFVTYEVVDYDGTEDEEYRGKVKPAQDSDKAILEKLIKQVNKR